MHQDSFLRWHDIHATTKLSRSTIWRLERAGKFPTRHLIGTKAVGWRKREVDAWLESRPHAKAQS